MNQQESGTPVFKIYKKLQNGKIKEVDEIYVGDSEEKTNNLICEKNEFTRLIPSQKERDILYICGSSGSGKSYFTKEYLKEYKNKHPKNDIYLFSSLKEDETLDKFKGICRVKLDENFLNEDFSIEDFKDTCCVFDDADCIIEKRLREKIIGIQNMILETGRHTKTTCIITNHLATNGFSTRRILNEASSITFFPNGMGARGLKYLLECYIGLDKNQIKKVKTLNSRAVTFVKSFPNIILHEKGAFILNQ